MTVHRSWFVNWSPHVISIIFTIVQEDVPIAFLFINKCLYHFLGEFCGAKLVMALSTH